MKEASHTRTPRTSGLRLLPGIGQADRALPRGRGGRGRGPVGFRRRRGRPPRVGGVAGGGGVEHEVRLESYDTFASVDLLSERTVASMLAGLSGRRYSSALEPVGEG